MILGAAIGALSCSKLLTIGKLRLIYYLNLTLCIAVSMTLVGRSVWLMCLGRLIWGISFGAFSVVCAKYVNEICPTELYGSFGAICSLMVSIGACLPNTMCLAYPVSFDNVDKTDFYVQMYWRYIWGTPLIFSAL